MEKLSLRRIEIAETKKDRISGIDMLVKENGKSEIKWIDLAQPDSNAKVPHHSLVIIPIIAGLWMISAGVLFGLNWATLAGPPVFLQGG